MPPTAKRPKRSTGQYTSSRVLTASSPVVTADIQEFLAMCVSGWDDNYTEDEKKAIIGVLPSRWQSFEYDSSGKLKCPLTFQLVHQDPYIKKSVSKFRSHVVDGFYGTGWQNQALRARHEKEAGKFDAYLEQKIMDLFGDGSDEAVHTSGQNGISGKAELIIRGDPGAGAASATLPTNENKAADAGTGTP